MPFQPINTRRVIKREYAIQSNYTQNTEKLLNLFFTFEQYCSNLQLEYKNFNAPASSIVKKLKSAENSTKFAFVKQMKQFFIQFFTIIDDISSFQIQCLDQLKQSTPEDTAISKGVLQNIRKFNAQHVIIQEKKNQFINNYHLIKDNYSSVKAKIKNPAFQYDKSYLQENKKILSQKRQNAETALQNIFTLSQTSVEASNAFSIQLAKFRKRLVKNKYSIHKKLFEVNQNSRYCILQMILLLKQCVLENKQSYLKVSRNKTDDIQTLKNYFQKQQLIQNEGKYQTKYFLTENVISSVRQYQQMIQSIVRCFQYVQSGLMKIGESLITQLVGFRKSMRVLEDYFQGNESLTKQIMKTMDLFEHINSSFTQIANQLLQQQNKLSTSCRNGQKHSQIMLSVLKIRAKSQINRRSSLSSPQTRNNTQNLQKLSKQISCVEAKQTILHIYDVFIAKLTHLEGVLNKLQSIKKVQVVDSMEISYINENKYKLEEKKPLKHELWLWKQSLYDLEVDCTVYTEYFEEIQQFMGSLLKNVQMADQTQLQKYDCVLESERNIKGKLFIREKGVSFSNSQNSVNIVIPWNEIDEFDCQTSIFKSSVFVKLAIGNLQFSKLQNAQKAVLAMKDTMQSQLSKNTGQVELKKSVQLSDQELKFIKQRKQKITPQLIKYDQFETFLSQVVQNVEIDDFYDMFFSDKPFNFFGKEETCFWAYAAKKAGNYDLQSNKYDKPGPKFYTLDESTTFFNTPLYSQRKFYCKHPIPPLPFMPKFCQSHDYRRLYWISNEQFDYLIHSQASGAPMAENFSVEIVDRVTKQGKNLRIDVMFKIIWVKQTLKSFIESNTRKEVINVYTMTVNQMVKILKLRQARAKQGSNPSIKISELEEQQKVSTPLTPHATDQISSLQQKNTILLVAFIALILINIIAKYFF